MALRELTLETLSKVAEGRIKEAVDMHLRKVVADCEDRPGSDSVRKVSLELLVVPSCDADTGEFDGVNIEFEIGSRVPKHRSKPVNCKVRRSQRGTMVLFNDLSEENANQRTLDETPGVFE